MELMVSREAGINGLRIAHHLNAQGRSLCCDRFGELYTYTGDDSVVMCGACVVKKEVREDPKHEPFKKYCRVYWGSHGCKYEKGHAGDDHVCSCCTCTNHPEQDSEGAWCTGAPPYYGVMDMQTNFYGEDVKEVQSGAQRASSDGPSGAP